MWHPPSPHSATKQPAVCTMDQSVPTRRVVPPLSPMEESTSNQQLASAMFSRRCVPQSPPHARRPLLNFPPPPAYPPPHPVREDLQFPSPGCSAQEHMIMFPAAHQSQTLGREDCSKAFHTQQVVREDPNMPGPSHQRVPQMHAQPQPSTSWDTGEPQHMPNDYSYAYYEPGPPTRHTNVPSRHPITGLKDRASRHTYLTRYGTEENIYEEISDVARARLLMRPKNQQHSVLSLNQSLVEEEVRRVQHTHRKVLGELNLSVEAMLMPASSSQEEDTDKEVDDQLADLLTVGPTDELLSPAPPIDLDSGFSGSSSGASYVGSMRRGPERFKNQTGRSTVSGNGAIGGKNSDQSSAKNSDQPSGNASGNKSFWSRKGWRKLPGLSGLGRAHV